MATYKIMLVEDDSNLRAIYGDRLLAEGYEIVSARDGEEGLATAVKEKPDLIISDVMMPKISGFDMVDILRTTPETKDVKIIMMTALSQAEDKARADKLGADKYLVKSQVTLEDVARVVHEVLGDQVAEEPASQPAVVLTPEATPASSPVVTTEQQVAVNPISASPAQAPTPQPIPNPITAPAVSVPAPQPDTSMPVVPPTMPTVQPMPDPQAPTLPTSNTTVSSPMPAPTQTPLNTTPSDGVVASASADSTVTDPTATMGSPDPTSNMKKVIQPLNTVDPNAQPKIYELYEKEMATEAAQAPSAAGTTVQMPSVMPAMELAPSDPMAGVPQIPAEPVQAPQTTQPQQGFDPNSVAL
jgi:CheY-like chemotaxis protein